MQIVRPTGNSEACTTYNINLCKVKTSNFAMQSLSSVVGAPSTSTSSLTDDKPSLMVLQFVALFNDFKAGRDIHSYPWEEFQLEPGEYDQLEREISRDESLSGYVKHKLR
jgi:hypothetical protein